MIQLYRVFSLFLVFSLLSFTQEQPEVKEFCGIRNQAFKQGEVIKMKVFYNSLGAYIGAGEATFTTTLERYNGKPVYHFVGTGKTFSFFDNFFRVRDRYESYVDTSTLLPYKFLRNVDEGGYKKYNNVSFNHKANTASSTTGVYKITDCIQDVVSAVQNQEWIFLGKNGPAGRRHDPLKICLGAGCFARSIVQRAEERLRI